MQPISFTSKHSAALRRIYLPLSGVSPNGIKSSITPFLAGDIKVDKNTYVTKPVSREDLRQSVRNVFVRVGDKGVVSLSEETAPDSACVEIGQLWHRLTRRHPSFGIELEALNFVPVTDDNVEVMQVTVRNISRKTLKITPTIAVRLFARAQANKQDHEHVTSLLHRTRQLPQGVVVTPTMLFNEEGHKDVNKVYFVLGSSAKGENPTGTFPTFDSFYSEQGTFERPAAVYENLRPKKLTAKELDGKEAVGALRFKSETLRPGAGRAYFIVIGTSGDEKQAVKGRPCGAPPARGMESRTGTASDTPGMPGASSAVKILRGLAAPGAVARALEQNKNFWHKITSAIEFSTSDREFNNWMKWVMLQPTLRRLWGCSFLPDHDYGKGGKGWRDLWQDLLALIMVDPQSVRGELINNFGGLRADGSNATIIGSKPGEFLADRNAITRVWMDHGAWPFLTAMLYVNQTGDRDILFEQASYFRDAQLSRTLDKDLDWRPGNGTQLKTAGGEVYQGTVLEHLLLQNLVQFFNVGEHNLIRLENADWNDGLDMAFERGESVAFSAMYAGNLQALAKLLKELAQEGLHGRTFVLAKEIAVLLDTLNPDPCDYDSVRVKKELLFERYFKSVGPKISGEKIQVNFEHAAKDLEKKAQWLFRKIREQEFISVQDGTKTFRWFNGYYDNEGQRVEGPKNGKVRMTLTGQVFPLMSGIAGQKEINDVSESVRRFLKDKDLGGIHLNTDFGVRNYWTLGRAFGFAYGTKENGAFFNHMTVMYAFALYKNGFAREGYKILEGLYKMSADTPRAKIYPGVPEYFDLDGRGMYPYLTGSASWLVLTLLTQVFGVRGETGNLVLEPKLVKDQFDKKGLASVECPFAGKSIRVVYENKAGLDYGQYRIKQVNLNGKPAGFEFLSPSSAVIERQQIERADRPVTVEVELGS